MILYLRTIKDKNLWPTVLYDHQQCAGTIEHDCTQNTSTCPHRYPCVAQDFLTTTRQGGALDKMGQLNYQFWGSSHRTRTTYVIRKQKLHSTSPWHQPASASIPLRSVMRTWKQYFLASNTFFLVFTILFIMIHSCNIQAISHKLEWKKDYLLKWWQMKWKCQLLQTTILSKNYGRTVSS